jgi:uncharacterized protein (DUF342 family)
MCKLIKILLTKFTLSFSAELVNGRDRYRHQLSYNLKSTNASGSESLTELLDGLILLYHVGVHKHYLKVAEVIDSLREYNESLTDIDNKLINCRDNYTDIQAELTRSKKIFEQQAEDLTRKIAWITIHVFSHVNFDFGKKRTNLIEIFSSRKNDVILLFYIVVFIVLFK